MKIFISWSGSRSHAVAKLLYTWMKCVIQALRPWISSHDIDRGSLWFTEINDQLKDKRLTESHSVINSETVQYFINIFFKGFDISRLEFH